MNIQRFGLPVIIAAGLHGALFLIMPDTRGVGPTPRVPPGAWVEPPTDCELYDPNPEVIETGPPAVSQCRLAPTLIDLPPAIRGLEQFTVPIEPFRPSPVRASVIPTGIGSPDGIDGAIGRGVPTLPGVGQLDQVPRAMVQPSPAYPAGARREGVGGTVFVEFVVGTDGTVVRAEAVKWTRRDFVDPAVRAVLKWRFEPGTIGGRRVSFRMAVPIEFDTRQ